MNKHSDFETIYRATFTTLSKHVYFKVAKMSDAEDIIQEVYLDYYRYIQAQDKDVENVQAYLIQIANNKLSHYYKDKAMMLAIEDDNRVFDQTEDPLQLEHTVLDKATLDQIFDEIMHLDEVDQHIMLGYYRFGLNYRELSEKLDMPESTIKSRAARIIEQLREKYK
jgi:RNA polymerase sigma-70 factor (ECF subfamily)